MVICTRVEFVPRAVTPFYNTVITQFGPIFIDMTIPHYNSECTMALLSSSMTELVVQTRPTEFHLCGWGGAECRNCSGINRSRQWTLCVRSHWQHSPALCTQARLAAVELWSNSTTAVKFSVIHSIQVLLAFDRLKDVCRSTHLWTGLYMCSDGWNQRYVLLFASREHLTPPGSSSDSSSSLILWKPHSV